MNLRTISVVAFLLMSLIFSGRSAALQGSTVELQHVTLPEAIRLLARHLNMNVILSPSIPENHVFNISKTEPLHALNMLLLSNGLTKWQKGNSWLIAPYNDLIKVKQEELKWKEINEETSPLFLRVFIIRYAKAADIFKLFNERSHILSKRGSLWVDHRTNSLGIRDTFTRLKNVNYIIKKLDVGLQQIAIEARLVSIDNDFERELGLHFSSEENTETSSIKSEKENYNVAVIKFPQGSRLDVKLAALENQGHAELISSPSLFTNNQQTASIEAGEEVPYQETSESGGTSIAFKKAVLGLKVTPQILPGNNILLQLQINQDRPSNKMVQGMPAISTRKIITNVLAKSGQTIVLGGIYEINSEKGILALPFIHHIPILGWLFKQHHVRQTKRELLIFVTPRVVCSN